MLCWPGSDLQSSRQGRLTQFSGQYAYSFPLAASTAQLSSKARKLGQCYDPVFVYSAPIWPNLFGLCVMKGLQGCVFSPQSALLLIANYITWPNGCTACSTIYIYLYMVYERVCMCVLAYISGIYCCSLCRKAAHAASLAKKPKIKILFGKAPKCTQHCTLANSKMKRVAVGEGVARTTPTAIPTPVSYSLLYINLCTVKTLLTNSCCWFS